MDCGELGFSLTWPGQRIIAPSPISPSAVCTEEEAAQIRANAREAKRPLSRFLAEAGARTPGAALPDVEAMRQERARDREVWVGMVYQLRRVGVNLNQLAHRESSADVGGSALPPTPNFVATWRRTPPRASQAAATSGRPAEGRATAHARPGAGTGAVGHGAAHGISWAPAARLKGLTHDHSRERGSE